MEYALTLLLRFSRPSSWFFWRVAIAALACTPVLAQTNSSPLQPAAPATAVPGSKTGPITTAIAAKPGDLSQEAVVFDKLYTRVREDNDGTGTRQTTARIRILADAGVKDMAVLAFTYTASSQQVDIGYVRVIKPDGSIVITPDYNIQDLPADVTREAPMYSDIHQKHVAVKGLGVGDTLEYQWTLRTLKPDVPGEFWLEYTFEKNLIVLDEQLDLDLPAGKPVTVACSEAQPAITTSGDRKLYHWTSSNLARPDPDAPPKSVRNWKPSVQVTTFTSWEQVGAWYASLAKDRLAITPAIQAHADTLTKGLISDEDKVRAIFNDVALHIHYVGLDFGISRYQPHPADDVLSNEYGDCKDKHTLLAALLKAAGIEAWPVLISTGRYLDPAMPSPAQFDHVITLVPLDGKLLWMDSTEEVASMGVLSGALRDKQALAVPVSKAAYLEHTPADLPFLQQSVFHVEGKLDDQGFFSAHFDETYRGDAEVIFRALFRSVPQSQWNQFIQGMLNYSGFAGEVKDPHVSPIEQIGQPINFSFSYTREKFGDWDAHRISPPLPPAGMELAPGVKQIKPADDIDLGSPGSFVLTSSIHLPEKWQLFPPKAVDAVEDWGEYHSRYTYADGVFTAERRLIVKKDKIPLADWDKYLAFRRAIYDDEVLMEPILSPAMAEAIPNRSYEAGALPIRQEIVDAIKPLQDAASILETEPAPTPDNMAGAARQSKTALDAIEQKSQTLSPRDSNSLYWGQALAYAWCVRGWSAFEANDLSAAESYLRAAWRLHPDRISGMLLGRLLEAKNNKPAAAHQYELAHVSATPGALGVWLSLDYDADKRIADGYRRVTGKEITAASLNQHGEYNGSLQEERDRLSEIHGFIRATKLTGSGLYTLAFEADKPVKATFLGGDKGFESLVSVLESHSYVPELPVGSKARLLREVKLICSPYAGCDAYLLLPNAIDMPSRSITINIEHAPPGAKTIEIKKLPVQP